MKTRIIQTRFWDDEFVVEATKLTKYLYSYLLTCQYINISGMFQLHDKKIMLETDLTPKELSDAKEELRKSRKVLFKDGWVFVVNAEKNNHYRNSPDNEKAYQRELSLIPPQISQYFNNLDSSVDSTVDSTLDSNHKSEIINNKYIRGIVKGGITGGDLEEISKAMNVELRVVEETYAKVKDYVASKGKVYRDYKATIRNWIRRDMERGVIKPGSKVINSISPEDAKFVAFHEAMKGKNG